MARVAVAGGLGGVGERSTFLSLVWGGGGGGGGGGGPADVQCS